MWFWLWLTKQITCLERVDEILTPLSKKTTYLWVWDSWGGIFSSQLWFRDNVFFFWIYDSAAKIMAQRTGKRSQCHTLLMYELQAEQQGIVTRKSIIWTLCSVHEIWQVWVMGFDIKNFVYPESFGATWEEKGFWCQQNQLLSEWWRKV